MELTLTVVIPALDEAERLPRLLEDLSRQTRRPDAVIVADAGSGDGTREAAVAHGATVVDGGMPGPGRNAGARAATTDLVLFLDADVALESDAIERMIAEFEKRSLDVASAFIDPIERDARYVFACEVVNFYLDVMQYVAPHAPGFCILVTRSMHDEVGGFDETLVLAEDHDYVERISHVGKFRILRTVRAATSMRRIAKEGLVSLSFKYLYSELQVMTGQKILSTPFEYEFAAFGPAEHVEPADELATARERLKTLAGTLQLMSSDGRDALRELAETEINVALLERALQRLRTDDVRTVERYVRARARLVHRGSKRALITIRSFAGSVWRELNRPIG